jgi:hypothetical protein
MNPGFGESMSEEVDSEVSARPTPNSDAEFQRGVEFFQDMSIMGSRIRWILISVTINPSRSTGCGDSLMYKEMF